MRLVCRLLPTLTWINRRTDAEVTMLLLIVLIILIIMLGGGGVYAGGNYRNGGVGIGLILVIILILYLLGAFGSRPF